MNWLNSVALFLKTATAQKLFESAIVILVLMTLSHFAKKFVAKRISDKASRYRWTNSLSYLFVVLGIIFVGRIWFGAGKSAATYLGLVSAGIAIALSGLISNLAGWIFILFRKPFVVGNRVQINDVTGDVIDLRPFQFTLMEIGNWVQADQPTGRFVYIPNGMVFSNPLFNYDAGFKYLWHEVSFAISFDSNWEKVRDIMLETTIRHCMKVTPQIEEEINIAVSRYLVSDNNLQPDVFVHIADNGIRLTTRYLTDVRKRRGVSDAIQRDLLTEFRKHDDISIADVNSIAIAISK